MIVVREPHQRLSNLYERFVWWFRSLIPRMELEERTDAYVRIRRNSRAVTLPMPLVAPVISMVFIEPGTPRHSQGQAQAYSASRSRPR